MHISRFNQGYPHEDYLDAEARAVIEADFEEIHPTPPVKTLVTHMREGWLWIRQRLQKT